VEKQSKITKSHGNKKGTNHEVEWEVKDGGKIRGIRVI
jgi:hypothetical protein